MSIVMYLVQITGKHVFHDLVNVCVMSRMSQLDDARHYIKEHYGVEFEELSAIFTSYYWKFRNITDDRDISLCVERIDDIEVIKTLK